MELNLTGKRAIVTAASGGLGRATALHLGREGVQVAVCSRGGEALRSVAEEIEADTPGQAIMIEMNLADGASIRAGVEKVVAEWGGVDILVGNAPGPPAGRFEDIEVDDWHRALQVNVLSMVELTQAVIPVMRRQGGGRITYISTVGVLVAQPAMVLSNSTRLAVHGMVKTLALELAPDNILVNAVCPGPIATERMQELISHTAESQGLSWDEAEAVWLDEVPLGRMGQPRDVASMIALLSSEACSYVTGAAIPIDGGKAKGT